MGPLTGCVAGTLVSGNSIVRDPTPEVLQASLAALLQILVCASAGVLRGCGRQVLEELCKDPNNHVVLASGRDRDTLARW